MRKTPSTLIVVPCYQEAQRFAPRELAALLEFPELGLVLVDDGSRDATPEILDRFCRNWPGRAEQLTQPRNQGKAEAVRVGLGRALDRGAEIVGYLDADLATPPGEVVKLLEAMREHRVEAVLAARVVMLGTDIRRSPLRHYLGRVFASAASVALGLRVYDTQCGAKLFRAGPALRAALDEPFLSRWAFDVELIGRLLTGSPEISGVPPEAFLEVPLRQWLDPGGSKLGPMAMTSSAVDLMRIAGDLRRRRTRNGQGAR